MDVCYPKSNNEQAWGCLYKHLVSAFVPLCTSLLRWCHNQLFWNADDVIVWALYKEKLPQRRWPECAIYKPLMLPLSPLFIYLPFSWKIAAKFAAPRFSRPALFMPVFFVCGKEKIYSTCNLAATEYALYWNSLKGMWCMRVVLVTNFVFSHIVLVAAHTQVLLSESKHHALQVMTHSWYPTQIDVCFFRQLTPCRGLLSTAYIVAWCGDNQSLLVQPGNFTNPTHMLQHYTRSQ